MLRRPPSTLNALVNSRCGRLPILGGKRRDSSGVLFFRGDQQVVPHSSPHRTVAAVAVSTVYYSTYPTRKISTHHNEHDTHSISAMFSEADCPKGEVLALKQNGKWSGLFVAGMEIQDTNSAVIERITGRSITNISHALHSPHSVSRTLLLKNSLDQSLLNRGTIEGVLEHIYVVRSSDLLRYSRRGSGCMLHEPIELRNRRFDDDRGHLTPEGSRHLESLAHCRARKS